MKILNIITGGMSSDGITSAWKNICKVLYEDKVKYNINLEFLWIEEVSDKSVFLFFESAGFNIISTPVRQSSPLIYFKNLRQIIKKGNYDIIHINGSSSFMLLDALAAKLAGIKALIAHSHNTTCNNKLLHNLLIRPFNKIITTRLACGNDAGRWLFGKNNYTIFHNGINLQNFTFSALKRTKVREKLDLNASVKAVGHVGKFNLQKNQEFVIAIFQRVLKLEPNVKLFLFGDGPLQNTIKELVEKLGLQEKVTFMGVVSNIQDYLQAMDIMLLPSRFEGLPNVVIEWQAAGLPSLISDSVTEECAVSNLVKFKSLSQEPDEWAKECCKMVKEFDSRENQSIEAIKLLEEKGFDIKGQVKTLLSLYQSIIP